MVSDGGGAPNRYRRGRLRAQLRRVVPIVAWLPGYPRADLRSDLIAAVTSWGVMVPVALAHASFAGLPPEYGLIAALAALSAYALLATSRHLDVTTSSTMAVMSVSLVAPLAAGGATRIAALSAALALIVGLLFTAGGLSRGGGGRAGPDRRCVPVQPPEPAGSLTPRSRSHA